MCVCVAMLVSVHHCLPVSSDIYSRPSCALVSRGVGTRDSERRERGRRRKRRKRGDVVVLEESDESADEVQIMEPDPEG